MPNSSHATLRTRKQRHTLDNYCPEEEEENMAPNRIDIDQNRCEGYGFCAEAAPELLELDDDGILHNRTDSVPEDLLERAEAAIRVCPVAALKLAAHS